MRETPMTRVEGGDPDHLSGEEERPTTPPLENLSPSLGLGAMWGV
jgi:hypothetical protein